MVEHRSYKARVTGPIPVMPTILMNTYIFNLINHSRHWLLDKFSIVLSHYVFLAFLVLALLIFVFIYDRKNILYILLGFALVTLIDVLVTELIFKNVFYQLRPYLVLPDAHTLGVISSSGAFPSGHMAMMTGLLLVFCFYERAFIIPSVFFLLLLGWSRIYNGAHWPSDVLWGTIFGFAYGFLSLTPFLFFKKFFLALKKIPKML